MVSRVDLGNVFGGFIVLFYKNGTWGLYLRSKGKEAFCFCCFFCNLTFNMLPSWFTEFCTLIYLLFLQSKSSCSTSSSTDAWLESSLEPSKPCCLPWATTNPPGRIESHPLVRNESHFLFNRMLMCRSVPESKGFFLLYSRKKST